MELFIQKKIVVFSGFWAESLYNCWEIVVYAQSSKNRRKISVKIVKNRRKIFVKSPLNMQNHHKSVENCHKIVENHGKIVEDRLVNLFFFQMWQHVMRLRCRCIAVRRCSETTPVQFYLVATTMLVQFTMWGLSTPNWSLSMLMALSKSQKHLRGPDDSAVLKEKFENYARF